ncbi:hypothetical protein AU468_11770 [Alkalispirochaeta sphaeroplastigenens]|uniref:Uncharacterized protein n=1 Tax=Alkalispirochaeta sphaeroplastigenens TaxID=1187066 RepID=A0A2S4JGW6_9SPIO|nr:hypothetical protein AU468_11770 [Alkalispirochaeta sphaeroplastigenens]
MEIQDYLSSELTRAEFTEPGKGIALQKITPSRMGKVFPEERGFTRLTWPEEKKRVAEICQGQRSVAIHRKITGQDVKIPGIESGRLSTVQRLPSTRAEEQRIR